MEKIVCFAFVVAVLAGTAGAQNIALNKPVTIVAGAGSQLAPTPAAGVVTDGLFLNEATPYSHPAAESGSVRWFTGIAGSLTLEVDLGGVHTIDGIIVQADDNDALLVTYLDENNTYQLLYDVQNISVGFGFRTRPNGNQVTWADLAPVNTSRLRITNNGGDGYYGISEFQLRGVAVGCDSIDFNNDGLFPDTADIDDFLSVFSGGTCSNDPDCGDIDFNNDGLFPDTLDIDALLSVFSGGPCLV